MGHCRKSQDRRKSNISLGRRVGILVLVSLLLAEGLLIEAKGKRGGGGGGRSRGRSRGRSWGGGGGGGGGGRGSLEGWEILLIVIGVIIGLIILCIICMCCAVVCYELCGDDVDNTGAKGETLPDEEDKRYIQGY